jgi:uncharacterized protein (TIGR02145 family)
MIRLLTAVAIVILCFNVEGYSQHNECIGDVIEIPLTGHKAGAIQWQFSNDLVTWTDLEGEVGDGLTTTVQETGYFRAEVTDNSCTYYSDTVNILAFLPPTIADAGEDQIFTDGTTSFSLSANVPEDGHGTGQWSILNGEGGSFDDITKPDALFTGELFTTYELQWNITTDCGQSADDVIFIMYNDGAPGEQVTDIDDNTYNTVFIGDQIWMAENLKVTKQNDGTDIPLVTDNTSWVDLTTPGYCWYDNDHITYANTYGALYNWYTIETSNLCPAGWHVPTSAEWTELSDYLGGNSVAGGKLKEAGTIHWNEPNTGATNESGFTALPGGYREGYDGMFIGISAIGFWRSADAESSPIIGEGYLTRYVSSSDTELGYSGDVVSEYAAFGHSVRCIKD